MYHPLLRALSERRALDGFADHCLDRNAYLEEFERVGGGGDQLDL
jgi:hypothetical protein